MIEKINSGDSSIDPYMEFANEYPVRDSMRMMRLLYRLGIGEQEKKQERLLMFSRTVSNLQNKARETKYKIKSYGTTDDDYACCNRSWNNGSYFVVNV